MIQNSRPDLARRLLWEAVAVRQTFGESVRLTQTAGGVWAWEGAVPVCGQDVPVRVAYPVGYPGALPTLESAYPLPSPCPHVLGRKNSYASLCWIAPSIGHGKRRWDPQRHTAATVLRAAQRWFLAFLVWRELGTWPVADAWDVRGGT